MLIDFAYHSKHFHEPFGLIDFPGFRVRKFEVLLAETIILKKFFRGLIWVVGELGATTSLRVRVSSIAPEVHVVSQLIIHEFHLIVSIVTKSGTKFTSLSLKFVRLLRCSLFLGHLHDLSFYQSALNWIHIKQETKKSLYSLSGLQN